MKDKDYVDEMLKIGDCGDCCPEGTFWDSSIGCVPVRPEYAPPRGIINQIKEMPIIPHTEGALVESTCEVEDDDTIISDKCPFAIDKADIIDHIKEMDVIPAYGGSK